ncbi:N-acetylmuramoyl-L-alanine amidase [Egibacter rhizosphaerae]|uniref:N-acetylmuramoyl-L-alanine amidase n=1 Tax=Egibacter rhizosphaerae TaxID=1670831 RepID=A0A411YFS6_9ACTN|nr:peptidoglycan-binding protein [Egibacter rhizosphaerae]QBI20011.1 N-acetylmuramoyl-L-alanine amidase [Egibacter rhizosphaerae]
MVRDEQAPPRIVAGDEGPAVRDVQERLARIVDPSLPLDGHFGAATLAAVRAFQRRRGLPANGVIGQETWEALVEASYTLGDRLLWHSRTPMRGDDVLELQRRLGQLGFDAGPEDAIFGRLTRAAVEEFQRNTGLAVDGVAGDATIRALMRLQRDHQSPGVSTRVREREALRRLAGRGLPGTRILVDPGFGVGHSGPTSPDGAPGHVVTWEVATRLVGRLAALGAEATLSRGPDTDPPPSERARLANELGSDVVLGIGVNAHHNPRAAGTASYYFGSLHATSEAGRRLAEHIHAGVASAGWLPDCRVHPVTWTLLRETRMPAVITEPGFLTSPRDAARLVDPQWQDSLADALASSLARFFSTSGYGASAGESIIEHVGASTH